MRIAVGVEYDGTAFSGWQSQPGSRTVQGSIEQALSKVADHPVQVVCAGRTDSGVHATGQVVHFDSDAPRRMRSWVLGANATLSADVAVTWAQPVDQQFHARFRALQRRYRYVILNRTVRPALARSRVCWDHRPLDARRMAQAGVHLVGEHDFSSFRALACQAKHPVRTVHRLDVARAGEHLYIDVTANAFLHHMVRNIAGVLIAVGRGEREPGWVPELLQARDRSAGGVTAPAGGLYLVDVRYPEKFDLPRVVRLPRFA
ncbi:MAG: tRNA pseudouridine(38-40) synthase TruA [Gammaproteobacteria bacterium]